MNHTELLNFILLLVGGVGVAFIFRLRFKFVVNLESDYLVILYCNYSYNTIYIKLWVFLGRSFYLSNTMQFRQLKLQFLTIV